MLAAAEQQRDLSQGSLIYARRLQMSLRPRWCRCARTIPATFVWGAGYIKGPLWPVLLLLFWSAASSNTLSPFLKDVRYVVVKQIETDKLNCKLNSTNGGTFSNSAEKMIWFFLSFSEGLSNVQIGPGIQNLKKISSGNVQNLICIKDQFGGG